MSLCTHQFVYVENSPGNPTPYPYPYPGSSSNSGTIRSALQHEKPVQAPQSTTSWESGVWREDLVDFY